MYPNIETGDDTLAHIRLQTQAQSIAYMLEQANIDSIYVTHEEIALLADLNRVTVTRAIQTINKIKPL